MLPALAVSSRRDFRLFRYNVETAIHGLNRSVNSTRKIQSWQLVTGTEIPERFVPSYIQADV